jgi:voltage-gated potassium channel Kch
MATGFCTAAPTAEHGGILPADLVGQLMLSVALSMAAAPLLFIIGDRIAAREAAERPEEPPDEMPEDSNPIVIAGFGRVGQIIGRVLLARKIEFTALDTDHEEVKTMKRFGIQAYYGNAAHLEVLHAAGLGEAKIFVLAIDNIEASLRAAELVRKNFPSVKIIARARNRFHAYRLMDIGVDEFVRETLLSSLEMSRIIFESLGDTPEGARQTVDRFVNYDVKLLKREQALYHDETQLIQSTREANEELAGLLEMECAKIIAAPEDSSAQTQS